MITVFMHIACIGNAWKAVTNELLSSTVNSGLYDAAEQIIAGVSGNKEDFTDLEMQHKSLGKIKWHYHGDVINLYEFPTLQLLQKHCNNLKLINHKVFYCHTKGVSKNPKNPFWKYWRQYMTKSCIEDFQKHVDALDYNDVSGDMWTDNTHFSGNFWWANATHINQLPDLIELYDNPKTIWEGHSFEEQRRLQCEMWIGMSKGIRVKENGILNMKPGFNLRIVAEADNVACPLNKMDFDKIYLINLNHRHDRLQKSMAEVERIGLENVKRFPAINAKALGITKKDLDNPGLIGCFLSHFAILQEAVVNNYKRLLIMEDDVTFINGFNEAMTYALEQLPSDWELVYLGYTERYGENTFKKRVSDSIVIPNDPWGTQAYIVQNEGIRILYENLQHIKDHIDIQISRYINPKLKVYELYPSLCPQSGAESDINIGTVKFKTPQRRGNFAQLN